MIESKEKVQNKRYKLYEKIICTAQTYMNEYLLKIKKKCGIERGKQTIAIRPD